MFILLKSHVRAFVRKTKHGSVMVRAYENKKKKASTDTIIAKVKKIVAPVGGIKRQAIQAILSNLQFGECRSFRGIHKGQANYSKCKINIKGDGSGVFKPELGERGNVRDNIQSGTMWRREIAAYKLDVLLGYNIVPPTTERKGVSGTALEAAEVGSIQRFMTGAKDLTNLAPYFFESENLTKMFLLDAIVNNTDRHSGNVMGRKIRGTNTYKAIAIDNGLSFGSPDKDRDDDSYIGSLWSGFRFSGDGYIISSESVCKIKPEWVAPLKTLTRRKLEEALSDVLSKKLIDETFQRVKIIVKWHSEHEKNWHEAPMVSDLRDMIYQDIRYK